MNEKQAQALIDALASQRDAALNQLAQVQAALSLVNAELAELKEKEKDVEPRLPIQNGAEQEDEVVMQ